MAPPFVINGDVAASSVKSAPATGRVASVYSEVQSSRIDHALPLPSVLQNPFQIVEDEIAKLFPNVFGQPSAMLVPNKVDTLSSDQKLRIGVVLSGGQAPGGHNVISGIYDYLQDRAKGSVLYGFRGGPAGIMKCKYVELNADYIYPTGMLLDEETFFSTTISLIDITFVSFNVTIRGKNLKTRVIGCPKTIDGDLKCKEVPTSFGFDTACKIYAEMIGNVMVDARSTGKYYHYIFILFATTQLRTDPVLIAMGYEEFAFSILAQMCSSMLYTLLIVKVAAKKLTLKNVTDYIVNVICKRSDLGYNYGVILIPEGLIDFIPEVQQLIAELNEVLAHDVVDEGGQWKKKLTNQSLLLFEFLPPAIQEQLMLERDPHGNVQVAKIETEKMLIQMVETELEKRKQEGSYKGHFKGQSHFFGYEGRCGLPTNFDSTYCYALGYGAGALLHSGKTGLISSVGNLGAPVAEWTVGGTALTSLMDVERRHGKFKPVIKKAMVELEGAPFKKFASLRDEWALKNRYISPGPIQFMGPGSDAISHTLLLELGAHA
uniref:Uncharacterized protein n=1 Tax=Salix viminalis TaxID=40686 RepID=A0A6N2KRG2_SALVM